MNKENVSNNVYGSKVITSFDKNKIWLSNNNGNKIINKISSFNEVENNNIISKELRQLRLNVDSISYKITVPKIYDWDSDRKVLSMEYCDGKNLEFILRDKTTYLSGLKILNELLKILINEGIYWIDFAPRNVLVADEKIHIVDFEKGFGNPADGVKEFLRNHVYEEYGSFSFLEDRLYNPDEVFDVTSDESSKKYYIPNIGPKRIKAMAKLLGYKEWLTKEEYLFIIKMFIIAEQPEVKNGEFVFPRVYLEQILKDKNINPVAFDNYAKKVLEINESKKVKIMRGN